ncbi:hypothetical protein LTR33_012329 [Friedmanniomyces endolithicus]|nr:hypothetical protein LTR33_012329 [Friedmanniomyces endolithicus]
MLDIAGLPQLSKECATRVPPPGAKIEDFLSRWSNTKVSLPAAVIVPANEEDIRAVIKYAACQGLRVLPVAGAHGTFVPIDDRCVYLDLSRFNTIELDEDAGAATFGGGGAITEAMIRTLGERGFYTSVPTSSAVGMAGYYLGGGSSPYNGLKGLAIDHILHIRIITADGESRDLSPSSPRKEDAVLFNVLCGAGLGFGHDEFMEESGLDGGGRVTAYASSLSESVDFTTVWSGHQIDEILRLKVLWDAKGVF